MAIYTLNFTRKKVSDENAVICNSKKAYEYLSKYCFKEKDLWREMVFAVFVDKNGAVLGHMLISIGGMKKCCIDHRLVAKAAIESLADAVIISHNHPSGNALPGKSDITETQDLKRSLAAVGIALNDHIVLGDGQFFSFADDKLYTLPA